VVPLGIAARLTDLLTRMTDWLAAQCKQLEDSTPLAGVRAKQVGGVPLHLTARPTDSMSLVVTACHCN